MRRAGVRARGRGCQAGYAAIDFRIEDQILQYQQEALQNRFLLRCRAATVQHRLLVLDVFDPVDQRDVARQTPPAESMAETPSWRCQNNYPRIVGPQPCVCSL